MAPPLTMIGYGQSTEIYTGGWLSAVVFLENDKYIASGHKSGITIWRVKDGTRRETMSTGSIWCLAVSRDGKWIAAGTGYGFSMWDAETHKIVFEKNTRYVRAVDFSPDSTKFLLASDVGVFVWDIASGNQTQGLVHNGGVSAKYSPKGDRIATATHDSVRVWDSNDGRILVNIKAKVAPRYNTGLVWFNDYLLVVSNDTIKQFDAATGSTVAQWSVPASDDFSCIALLAHGKFIAYSTKTTVTFWNASTHTQLGCIQHFQNIGSIAVSPDDQFIAVGGKDGKISIIPILPTADSAPSPSLHPTPPKSDVQADGFASGSVSSLHPTLRELDIQIDDTVLESWKCDHLDNAEALLTAGISESHNPSHHLFASRALIRTRLGGFVAALEDAKRAIDIRPSVIGFIAKSVAHVGKGERHKAYRACDIAFEHFHSSHVTSLLLLKAIIVFMAGEHSDAISRIDDLVATVPFNSTCYKVQAYMHLLLGDLQMESCDYEDAIQSFERAQARVRDDVGPPLLTISLITGWKFDNLSITIRQRLCKALDVAGHSIDAVKRFHELKAELGENGEHLEWVHVFQQCLLEKMVRLGDNAMNSMGYDKAISYYTTALSLFSSHSQPILVKRSKAHLAAGSRTEALDDANEAIALDPSSPWGYEIKHAALHKDGDYDNAIDALEVMLAKIAESRDPDVRQYGDRYIHPSSTQATIRKIVQQTLRHSPRVLVNTATGRLCDRTEQTAAFESLLVFKELVSSTTTRVNYVRIKREVREYFRYVMLSHKWEDNEPLYHQVVHITVYDLEQSSTHDKLQTFCRIVRNAGFNWAWSDTCCIDKLDQFILQEALVAMFKWYQGAAMVIVFLRGVRHSSPRGALAGSLWNSRAWTLQEYIAAKVVCFYTEDWTLYQDLELPNHKELPEVIAEMEEATGVSAEQLMSLRPGLSNIREKLRLASTRRTTLVEDAAYSLLGIFSAIGIHAIYGEGEASLGRLLANVLTRSGDASILAWTGEPSTFNSCLPAHITVFDGPATTHYPPPIPDPEMDRISRLCSPSFDLNVALRLYDCLNKLPTPRFAESRMTLPCIAFQLPSFRSRSGRVYRANTSAFGTVEIRTRYDLSRMRSLYLVHPWLDNLVVHGEMSGGTFTEDDVLPLPSPNTDNEGTTQLCDEELGGGDDDDDDANDDAVLSEAERPFAPTPTQRVPVDRETSARQLVARLRRPFGALLLTVASTGRRDGAVDYKRVAADSLIIVQLQESVSLADILDNVRVLDVL